MHVSFFNLDKRQNSTLQATAADIAGGVTFDNVYLKKLTNIDNPTLYIDGATTGVYGYNYAYIQEWGRYYFVKSADLQNDNIFKVDLELDDLATYKTQILNTTAYVIYSSSDYDRWIKDDRVPIVLHGSEYVHSACPIIVPAGSGSAPLFKADDNECVLITTVSKGGGKSDDPTGTYPGGLVTWITTEAGVKDIIDALTVDNSIWSSLRDQFGDAMGSIVQIMRLPVDPTLLPSDGNFYALYLGESAVIEKGGTEPIYLKRLSKTHISYSDSVGIPTTYLDFRRAEPYINMRVQLPFIGVVDVSSTDFPKGSIGFKFELDLLTGSIVWTLFDPDSHESEAIATYSGQIGSLIPIASQQIANSAQLVTSAAASAAGIGGIMATGNIPGATFAGIAAAANAFYNYANKSTTIVGSYSGNRSEFTDIIVRVIVEKLPTAIEPDTLTAIEGRPCCKVVQLSTLTGYCKTQGFSISLPVNKSVIDSINAKLDSGIYIE